MLLALSSIPLVVLLLLFPLLPESPHYLLTKGEVQKAEAVLVKMARVNGTSLPAGRLAASKIVQHADSNSSSKLKNVYNSLAHGMKKIFSPALRRTSILLHYTWVTNAMTYYGLVLLTTELHAEENDNCVGDDKKEPNIDNSDYRDIFIATMAESVGLVLAYLMIDRFGLLKSMAGYLFECAIALLPLVFFNLSVHQSTSCLFLARAGIVGSFTVIYTYTAEVYPTAIRSFVTGFANAWSRFGGLMAPFVAVELVDSSRDWLAEIILIGMCLVAGTCTLLMPTETAGRELQDDDEIEMTSVITKQPSDVPEPDSPPPL
ncbi:hypothetical protein BSKO_09920 [Bryopsis sp. KO-2023]|nr:hypothetical protein BSKO_09920 [Bryopsis sp. KO-2023]